MKRIVGPVQHLSENRPIDGLRDFDREDVHRPEHVGPENDPLHVRRKGHVGLQAVVVFAHIHQPFGVEEAGVDQAVGIRRLDAGHIRHALGPEQVDPLTIGRARHHFAVAAVSREQGPVGRHVEVHRPFIALQVIPGALPRRNLVAGQPEILAARRLQVVPDRIAVRGEELVARQSPCSWCGCESSSGRYRRRGWSRRDRPRATCPRGRT